MKHGEKSRLDYMLRRLNQAGEIGRGDLIDVFDISKQQASKDIATFTRLYPDAIIYNLNAKVYKATQHLPVLPPEPRTFTASQVREAALDRCFLPPHVVYRLVEKLEAGDVTG